MKQEAKLLQKPVVRPEVNVERNEVIEQIIATLGANHRYIRLLRAAR